MLLLAFSWCVIMFKDLLFFPNIQQLSFIFLSTFFFFEMRRIQYMCYFLNRMCIFFEMFMHNLVSEKKVSILEKEDVQPVEKKYTPWENAHLVHKICKKCAHSVLIIPLYVKWDRKLMYWCTWPLYCSI